MPQQKRKQKKAVSNKVKETVKRCHNSYSVEQKKQIVSYASENGIIKAANYFELDKGMISRWVKLKEKWLREPKQNNKQVGA
ncbi:12207_t:CDS:1, partial [Funneliformis geosporum]